MTDTSSFWAGTNRDVFIAQLGSVFEHSRWIAERAIAAGPFDSLAGAFEAMAEVVMSGTPEEQLALLRAHPDLAGKAALRGELTDDSSREQAGAGLDTLSAEEMNRFQSLNDRYRTANGFPFIIAVAGLDKHDILNAFEIRLDNKKDAERRTALEQVLRIGRLRADRLDDN